MNQNNRKRLAIGLFLASIVGTGLISGAALTDNLNITNNYAVASVDLQASTDGTAYTESASFNFAAIKPGLAYAAYNKVNIRNIGTSALNYTLAWSSTPSGGSNPWGTITFDIAYIADINAACDGTTTFSAATRITGAASSTWPVNSQPAISGPDTTLNSGQVKTLCMKATASAVQTGSFVDGTLAQTMTFAGTAQ